MAAVELRGVVRLSVPPVASVLVKLELLGQLGRTQHFAHTSRSQEFEIRTVQGDQCKKR
jgi:hypothetical protein